MLLRSTGDSVVAAAARVEDSKSISDIWNTCEPGSFEAWVNATALTKEMEGGCRFGGTGGIGEIGEITGVGGAAGETGVGGGEASNEGLARDDIIWGELS